MKFKCKTDRYYLSLIISTQLILLIPSIIYLVLKDYLASIIALLPFLLVLFIWISSSFGYVVLKEDELFIKYGFILKKTIPYNKIRSLEKKKKWYTEAMLGMKNSLEHVDIKYNKFDLTCVSVKDNDSFIDEVNKKIEEIKGKSQ